MLDLLELDTTAAANEGVVMQVRHFQTGAVLTDNETGEPITIRLAGVDSDRYRRLYNASLNRRFKMGGRRGGAVMTAEELEAEKVETLVACTIDWKHVALGGQKLECNAVNARRVYSTISWLREQADDFINDRSNFLKDLARN